MKKHIPLLIALALLSISLISSCKKDPIPNNDQNNNQPTDTIPAVTDVLYFGDSTGMIVTTYNSVMEFDDNSRPLLLDLNGDGADDIKIETIYDGPLAIGEYQTLTLYCLNSRIELLGDSIVKESYSHRDTTITTNNGWTTTTYGYTFSTCDKIDETDYVGNAKVFELTACDANDPLSLNDHFQFAEVKLFKENEEYDYLHDYNEEEHYVVRSHKKYIYNCWYFPTDEEKYIGFKLTKNGTSRLGWLKIMLCPTWDGRVVNTKLIEIAIEE